ncbi:DNA polymerase-3 subunit alpha [Paenibacillus sp. UNC496MF]|uniref:DNA polymerase III subunit alpha n=1 Tax=Paenibacillus sp. UNC496MF TaxID=1502753 RepID=UPI0008EE09F4|nr:DNA polymerase III subunit alpha [Paenibacillus sp. UNC496MF]SFJ65015.1 DNA polymerase-3 subunit alpha [Paenibacillus sp. UNC496MF]
MCVHLHVHSEFSQLDGLSQVTTLAKRAKELGSMALAITDHGVCGAIPGFIKACKKEGIKPIPGCEAYMTKDRLLKGDFMKEKRTALMDKYAVKDKPLKQFIKHIERNPQDFEVMARQLLAELLMKEDGLEMAAPVGDGQLDLFSMAENAAPEEKLNTLDQFREDIYDYLQYDNYHLVLIAINNKGLEDLYEIVSDAHLNGFYSDPRTDLAFIRERNLGADLIATSACLGSWFSRLALAGRLEDARAFIQECKETFHSFYLEKQATRIPDQLRLNALIDQLAAETNTPKIVTTDVHYAYKEDNVTHDVLVAASIGKCVSDEDRLIYAHEFWMKDEQEIREIVNDDEAIANTHKIAELVNVDLPKTQVFPRYTIEEGDTAELQLEKQAWNELFTYALKKPINLEQYARQLKYELEIICKQGFADYFLIVSDYIQWAKRNGYRVGPGRGSAAGSLVAYLIKITTLDPIEWNLMFERFLNPERAGYPDIDVDFSYEGAKAVQEYMKQKYGADRVAQIGTYGTLAARAVIRKVGKTLGYSLTDQDVFAKSIPEKPGIELSEAHAAEQAVQHYANMWPQWWETALKLEGHVNQEGVHAGGIVLSPIPLTKTVPLRKDKEGLTTTMYDMEWIEKFLVKFDILKLDTLDLIKLTMENAGLINFDIDAIDLNDPRIYSEIYNTLNLSGIFQVESDLYRKIISDMKPNSVQDISVIVALGRPGPMDLIPSYVRRKWGQERVTYPFPQLQEVLEGTYGVWVYQEQIMKASVIMGGFTTGQSDMLRKGISKKKHDIMNRWIDLMIYGSAAYKEMQQQRIAQYPTQETIPVDAEGKPTVWVDYDYAEEAPDNIPGALSRGYDEATLLRIKEQWIKFGEYCFNYAHSACYAVLSVQTAFLKCYYPTEFMAALLTISEGKKDKNGNPKSVGYMHECEEMGIRILPPDINQSNASWTPIPNTDPNMKGKGLIRYGLGSIAGISGDSVIEITNKRPYDNLEHMLFQVNRSKVNKTKVEALIKSGCFDSTMNPNRYLHWRTYIGSRGEAYEDIPAKTMKRDILAFEKEYLGASVSVKSRWEMIPDGKEDVSMTGIVQKVEPFKAKKTGTEHCRIMIETAEDEVNVMVFNKLWKDHYADLQVGRKVQIRGNKSKMDLLADKITYVTQAIENWEVDFA